MPAVTTITAPLQRRGPTSALALWSPLVLVFFLYEISRQHLHLDPHQQFRRLPVVCNTPQSFFASLHQYTQKLVEACQSLSFQYKRNTAVSLQQLLVAFAFVSAPDGDPHTALGDLFLYLRRHGRTDVLDVLLGRREMEKRKQIARAKRLAASTAAPAVNSTAVATSAAPSFLPPSTFRFNQSALRSIQQSAPEQQLIPKSGLTAGAGDLHAVSAYHLLSTLHPPMEYMRPNQRFLKPRGIAINDFLGILACTLNLPPVSIASNVYRYVAFEQDAGNPAAVTEGSRSEQDAEADPDSAAASQKRRARKRDMAVAGSGFGWSRPFYVDSHLVELPLLHPAATLAAKAGSAGIGGIGSTMAAATPAGQRLAANGTGLAVDILAVLRPPTDYMQSILLLTDMHILSRPPAPPSHAAEIPIHSHWPMRNAPTATSIASARWLALDDEFPKTKLPARPRVQAPVTLAVHPPPTLDSLLASVRFLALQPRGEKAVTRSERRSLEAWQQKQPVAYRCQTHVHEQALGLDIPSRPDLLDEWKQRRQVKRAPAAVVAATEVMQPLTTSLPPVLVTRQLPKASSSSPSDLLRKLALGRKGRRLPTVTHTQHYLATGAQLFPILVREFTTTTTTTTNKAPQSLFGPDSRPRRPHPAINTLRLIACYPKTASVVVTGGIGTTLKRFHTVQLMTGLFLYPRLTQQFQSSRAAVSSTVSPSGVKRRRH